LPGAGRVRISRGDMAATSRRILSGVDARMSKTSFSVGAVILFLAS
jgi:hypothetical protein